MRQFKTLHFSFGPVQSFVAQARRTRDLWAGSYLLSYLAGKAMLAIEQYGGTIEFPPVTDDPLMKALRPRREITPSRNAHPDTPEGLAARIGSLPNRFMASVPDSVDGTVAVRAIQDAWAKVAGAVLAKLTSELGGVLPKPAVDIWTGQVQGSNVWECHWAIGEESNLLDLRKNLRHHFPMPEPGIKCTQCGECQALWDGQCRPLAADPGRTESELQATRRFWKEVAQAFRGLHFRPDGSERLCAVCTIKRVFPLVGQEAIDWDLNYNYPSTAYLAAIDWIIEVLTQAAGKPTVEAALKKFLDAAGSAGVECTEAATRIQGISELLSDHPEWLPLADLDGDACFPDAIRNEREFLLELKSDPRTGELNPRRRALLDALAQLTSAANASAKPFYTVLVMDGDGMGRLLSAYFARRSEISKALAAFTRQVPRIVANHDGAVVYAGGDDVFAFLPLEKALRCARALKEAYVQAFQREAPGIQGTISAAVVYAHMNTPLRTVVRDSHRLLDDITKDEVGRNAFAVRVWKRGGPILTLAKPWSGDGIDWQNEIEALKSSFSEGEYSSAFFYRLRDLFELLDPPNGEPVLTEDQSVKLLTAEYLKSRKRQRWPEDEPPERICEEAERRVRRLLDLCREEWTDHGQIERGRLRADGGLFLRFLAHKEV